jgi:hypothetical protein
LCNWSTRHGGVVPTTLQNQVPEWYWATEQAQELGKHQHRQISASFGAGRV